MPTTELSATTLITVFIAGSFLSDFGPQTSGFVPILGGLILLTILFSYDREGARTGWQSLGFGGVAGLCAATAIAPIADLLAGTSDSGASSTIHVAPTHVTVRAIAWLIATIVFALIDRARMGSRTAPARADTRLSYAPSPGLASIRPPAAEASPTYTPPPPQSFAATTATAPSQSRPLVYASTMPEPVQTDEPPPVSSTAPVVETQAQTPVTPSAPPPPQAIELPPTGAGKLTTVYLNLLDQGIACLRTVQAEHLGRDYYRIVEPEPDGENWEFHPGQVVRCRKQKLSNGKALVAFEEAPRAV